MIIIIVVIIFHNKPRGGGAGSLITFLVPSRWDGMSIKSDESDY